MTPTRCRCAQCRLAAFSAEHRLAAQMIIRAHECVMDGFERFAAGQLITVFSATNYCGTANNAGAILALGRDLVRPASVLLLDSF